MEAFNGTMLVDDTHDENAHQNVCPESAFSVTWSIPSFIMKRMERMVIPTGSAPLEKLWMDREKLSMPLYRCQVTSYLLQERLRNRKGTERKYCLLLIKEMRARRAEDVARLMRMKREKRRLRMKGLSPNKHKSMDQQYPEIKNFVPQAERIEKLVTCAEDTAKLKEEKMEELRKWFEDQAVIS